MGTLPHENRHSSPSHILANFAVARLPISATAEILLGDRFGRPFVKRSALYYHVCLSETLVYCGQTVEWIKMKLGLEVGLGLSHIVLDGNPAPSKRGGGTVYNSVQLFGPCVLWPNGWMNQDATSYGGRPRPRPHCVR